MALRNESIRRQSPETAVLGLSATGWSIAFTGCPDVVTGLEAILLGWDIRRDASAPPDAWIVKAGPDYLWESRRRTKPVLWDKRPPQTAMNVIGDVHDVLFDWYLADHPKMLCLHAGALDFGPGLVCFPSTRKAGKSTLAVALAMRGHRFFCDDVLPVEPLSLDGIAMGIAPLLRKPLPASLGSDLLAFVAGHAGPGNANWTYVRLGPERAAPFGCRKPIQALVLLERRDGAPAALEPIPKADMMREAVMQNFGARGSPTLVLDSFATLIETRDCFRMVYADVMEAAGLLGERFA